MAHNNACCYCQIAASVYINNNDASRGGSDVGAGAWQEKAVSSRGPGRSLACDGCRSVAWGKIRSFLQAGGQSGALNGMLALPPLTPCRPAGRSTHRHCRDEICSYCDDPTKTPEQIRAHIGGKEKAEKARLRREAAAAAAAGAAGDGGPVTPPDGMPRNRQPSRKLLESGAAGSKRPREAGQMRHSHKG